MCPKNTIPTVKHGGESIIIGLLFCIIENTNGAMYQDILDENLISWARKTKLGRRWMFHKPITPNTQPKQLQTGFYRSLRA